MIYIINFIVVLALSILTTSISPSVRILNVVPLLPLFFLISISFKRKGFEPIFLAVVSGIILDAASSYPFGVYLVLFLAVCAGIKVFFGEGLNELRLQYFLFLTTIALGLFLTFEHVFLGISGIAISLSGVLKNVLSYLIINLVFSGAFFYLGNWYFDKIIDLENYLKKR